MNPQRWFRTLLFVLSAVVFARGVQAQDVRPEFQLGPGDTIRISVYQNPDLTLETRVTENGTITFPLIGSVKIGGMTAASAEKAIANALRAGSFVKQPQVNILPLQMRSRQVSVLGQVGRPGRFPLETSTTSVSEMIAIAGGIAPGGADTVILTGVRDGKPLYKEIDIVGGFLNNQRQDNIAVTDGDEIYVHRAPIFYIYGEIQRPGSYRIERSMTIRQALAQGGGITARGTERSLTLYRRTAGVIKVFNPNPNDLVRPDDVLSVGESLF